MSSSRITYTPRPDATPEGECDALASVYAYLLKKPARNESSPSPATLADDGGIKGDSADARIMPE